MIPDFKTYIKESIWSDIQDRSSGDTIRKEDDVNLLSLEDFVVYLHQHYEIAEKYKSFWGERIMTVSDDKTNFVIKGFNTQYKNHSYYIPLEFWELKKGCKIFIIKHKSPSRLYDLMSKKFVMTETKPTWGFNIRPKKGKVDKKFFISVLDFIIDNAEPPEWSMLKRKDDEI